MCKQTMILAIFNFFQVVITLSSGDRPRLGSFLGSLFLNSFCKEKRKIGPNSLQQKPIINQKRKRKDHTHCKIKQTVLVKCCLQKKGTNIGVVVRKLGDSQLVMTLENQKEQKQEFRIEKKTVDSGKNPTSAKKETSHFYKKLNASSNCSAVSTGKFVSYWGAHTKALFLTPSIGRAHPISRSVRTASSP